MKTVFSTILISAISFSGQAISQESRQRYIVSNGVLSGFGTDEPPRITLMIDSETGKTWMLGVVENKPMWLALPFNPTNPAHTLPPPQVPQTTSE
jgi:hypothetical protein